MIHSPPSLPCESCLFSPLTYGHTKGQTQLGEMRGTFNIPHVYRTRVVTCTMPDEWEKLNAHNTLSIQSGQFAALVLSHPGTLHQYCDKHFNMLFLVIYFKCLAFFCRCLYLCLRALTDSSECRWFASATTDLGARVSLTIGQKFTGRWVNVGEQLDECEWEEKAGRAGNL